MPFCRCLVYVKVVSFHIVERRSHGSEVVHSSQVLERIHCVLAWTSLLVGTFPSCTIDSNCQHTNFSFSPAPEHSFFSSISFSHLSGSSIFKRRKRPVHSPKVWCTFKRSFWTVSSCRHRLLWMGRQSFGMVSSRHFIIKQIERKSSARCGRIVMNVVPRPVVDEHPTNISREGT